MIRHDLAVELFYGGAWNDHAATGEIYTGDATNGADIQITHGKRAWSGGLTPASATLVFKSWRFNPDNVAGDLYGLIGRNTPIRITVDGDVRFAGEVASWTPRQTLGGDIQVPDRWVEVEAGGVLRRLQAGTDPLPSSLRTFITTNAVVPVAYWPLDGGEVSRAALPAIGRWPFQDTTTRGAQLAAADIAPWLEPGVALNKSSNVAEGAVTMATEPAQWTADAILCAGDAGRNITFQMQGNGHDSGGYRLDWGFAFQTSAGTYELATILTKPGAFPTITPVSDGTFELGDDLPHHIRITVADNGANVDWDIYIDGDAIDSGTLVGQDMMGVGSALMFSPGSTGTDPARFAHIAVWDAAPPALADTVEAAFGYVGETAGDRFTRLSGESAITDTLAGTAAETIPMGPQFRGTLAAQYAELEATDVGILVDTVTAAGVTYKTGRDRYNQAAALTVDYAAFELAPPLQPVIDDKLIRNDITASRREGTTFRAVDEASVAAVGRYTDRPDTNVFSDLVVDATAGWHLHDGTTEATRFDRVTVDLDASPHLQDAVVATGAGDRIDITNLPAELTPNTVSLIVSGWSETIAPDRRKLTFNTVPEAPLHIAEVEHATYATVGALAAVTNEAVDAFETAITMFCGSDGPWTFETAFDVVIGGEQMTVTAIAAAAGTFPNQTQVLTVVRGVNGLRKVQANDAVPIQLANAAYIGL